MRKCPTDLEALPNSRRRWLGSRLRNPSNSKTFNLCELLCPRRRVTMDMSLVSAALVRASGQHADADCRDAYEKERRRGEIRGADAIGRAIAAGQPCRRHRRKSRYFGLKSRVPALCRSRKRCSRNAGFLSKKTGPSLRRTSANPPAAPNLAYPDRVLSDERGRFLEAILQLDRAKAGRTGAPRNGRWPGGWWSAGRRCA